MKTVYWTYWVSAAFNDEDYKALERRFAPHSAACNKVDPVFTNLWLGYFLGRHRPTRILAAVERAHPGANACLRSPLWPALTDRQLTRSQINRLLRQLEPEIRDVVWASSQDGTAGAKQATMLELRARLDALAAEILLLRLAHLDGQREAAFLWGRSVWRMMVLLGPALICGGIALALADLLEERIMPMARRKGAHYGFPPGHYLQVVSKFVLAIRRVAKGSPELKTDRQLLRIGQDLLGSKWGFGYFWAFNPVPLLDAGGLQQADFSPAASVEFDLASKHLNLHRWGLNVHSLGGHRNSPPDAASSGEDLWAIDPNDPYVFLEPEPFRTRQFS
ncbi:hypothetical protein [Roseateles puraquae]|uniref:Uncharacterized protein n=1 Tax=Roseateles puraquae TaxID=431059 RepID=A0A254N9A6_9BURK|nr:hypothetical protein [Roseateles puraquae]MDG0854803.1 hypothetical protein [Roseateles puraquae]OWR04611.1 hypothetical protein CDO81_08495 [Roseateles puraquae]